MFSVSDTMQREREREPTARQVGPILLSVPCGGLWRVKPNTVISDLI